MLNKWLQDESKMYAPATWDSLISALRQINFTELASELEDILGPVST